METKITDDLYRVYTSNLLSGNRRECNQIVENVVSAEADVRDIYLNLFQRSMYEVGSLWEHNKISVSVEHLATSITMTLINTIYPLLFSPEKKNKSAVIACVENEYHQLGSQMVSDIFELNGWNGYYLGGNSPVGDLLKFIETNKPDVVGLSLAIYFNMQNLWKTVEQLQREFPHIPVLVGGQAFRWGGREIAEEFRLVEYAGTLPELETYIHKLEKNNVS
ncbi:MAG: cobalamin-dependent protein [Candidatus Stygibacter frigidus]|nr:cobalamin-dependent protein [Candidatus Stygibacter frigidus]